MEKIKAIFKRFFKTNSDEKMLLAYNKEVREAIKRKNEVMYWIYDIARYGPQNR